MTADITGSNITWPTMKAFILSFMKKPTVWKKEENSILINDATESIYIVNETNKRIRVVFLNFKFEISRKGKGFTTKKLKFRYSHVMNCMKRYKSLLGVTQKLKACL
jgi:hypothetical protein